MSKHELSGHFSKSLITIPSDASIFSAAQLMSKHHIRHLPVMNLKEVVGIISDRDVNRAAKVDFYPWGELHVENKDFDPKHTVQDFMNAPVEFVDVKASLAETASKMIERRVSSVIVKDSGMPIGIVTSEDLLRIIVNHFSEERRSYKTLWFHWKSGLLKTPIASFIAELNSSGI